MSIGFGHLRLSSTHFWSMTPKELEAAITALTGDEGAVGLTRSNMNELLLQFPDEVKSG